MFDFNDYVPLSVIQDQLNRKRTYMYHWVKEFEGCGRYPPRAVIRDGRNKYILRSAANDFILNRERIQKRGLLPPFRTGGLNEYK